MVDIIGHYVVPSSRSSRSLHGLLGSRAAAARRREYTAERFDGAALWENPRPRTRRPASPLQRSPRDRRGRIRCCPSAARALDFGRLRIDLALLVLPSSAAPLPTSAIHVVPTKESAPAALRGGSLSAMEIFCGPGPLLYLASSRSSCSTRRWRLFAAASCCSPSSAWRRPTGSATWSADRLDVAPLLVAISPTYLKFHAWRWLRCQR